SLRAKLRLYDPDTEIPLLYSFSTPLPAEHLPIFAHIENSRVIKWIVAATEGVDDNYVIYWYDTIVEIG
ncbi:hypothetical protein HK104_008117, partial [Borealophlyctis nickersoniae]